jgi:spore coat protein JB
MDYENQSCENLLLKIQELTFGAVDLNLYLDNHPENKNALSDFNAITRELIKAKKLYEAENGPLANFGCSESSYPWEWINEPWPWEMNE